jgi:N utilization substance protein A
MINVLESRTGAHARDVVFTEDSIIFVVGKDELGRVIGKKGSTIAGLRQLLGRNIEVFESADTVKSFLSNFFAPTGIKELKEENNDGKTVITLSVDPQGKGLAIGRHGEKIKKARMLAKRLYNIDEIKIV